MSDHPTQALDPDDLVRWAESYGHPEEWCKRAQAAHMRAEKAEAALEAQEGRLREAECLLEIMVHGATSGTICDPRYDPCDQCATTWADIRAFLEGET